MSKLRNLCIITGALTHSSLDGRNVRYLRTDVEMDEFETMCETSRLEHFARSSKTCRIETHLPFPPAARRPFSSAFTIQAHTNANVRFHADFLCRANRLLKFFELLRNDDHLLIELATKQRNADERCVFVAI